MTDREPDGVQTERNALLARPAVVGHPSRWRRPAGAHWVLAGAAIVGVLGIAAEVGSASVRNAAVNHPITVSVVVGIAFLVLTVLGVERFVATTEAKRWAEPAREVLNTWVFAADQAVRVVGDGIKQAAAELPSPPRESGLLASCAVALAEQDPDALRRVSDHIRNEATRVATVAMGAGTIVARTGTQHGAIKLMFDAQRALDEIADICWQLPWGVSAQGRAGTASRKHAERIHPFLRTVGDNATHIRLYVLQSRDAE